MPVVPVRHVVYETGEVDIALAIGKPPKFFAGRELLFLDGKDFSGFDLDAGTAPTVLKLMEALDDHDDVQNVSANFNIPDEAMAQINAG